MTVLAQQLTPSSYHYILTHEHTSPPFSLTLCPPPSYLSALLPYPLPSSHISALIPSPLPSHPSHLLPPPLPLVSHWSYSRPPLMWAVHNGLPHAVQEMLSSSSSAAASGRGGGSTGDSVNACDGVGRTALHECAALIHARTQVGDPPRLTVTHMYPLIMYITPLQG